LRENILLGINSVRHLSIFSAFYVLYIVVFIMLLLTGWLAKKNMHHRKVIY